MAALTNTSWSIQRFLPTSLKVAIGKVPPEMLEKSEYHLRRDLQKQVGKQEMRLFEMLKVRFWDLYRESLADPRNRKNEVTLVAWLSEFCTKEWYMKHLLNNPTAMAFVVSPPPQEFTRMKVTVNRAIERLSEVFELPLTSKDNRGNVKVNTALIGQMHSIAKTLLERVHGGVVQRAQIHTHNTSDSSKANIALPDTEKLGDIAAQLENLQKQLSAEGIEPEGDILDAVIEIPKKNP